jgi:urea transport system permease protein
LLDRPDVTLVRAFTAGLAALLLAVMLALSPVAAQTLGEAVTGLKESSFEKRLGAVADIAASGDPRAKYVLDALGEGDVYIAQPGNRIVIPAPDVAGSYIDAATAEMLGEIPQGALARVRINNRMRGAIRDALGSLTLLAQDPAVRMSAARTLFAAPDASAIGPLDAAIEAETEPNIKLAMQQARAAAVLSSDAPDAVRLAAISLIRPLNNQDALALLRPAATGQGPVAEAAARAAAEIEASLAMWRNAQNAIYGLSLGSVLLLAAIGLAITFGVMGVINMAHGEMVMLGAYTTFVVQESIRQSRRDCSTGRCSSRCRWPSW